MALKLNRLVHVPATHPPRRRHRHSTRLSSSSKISGKKTLFCEKTIKNGNDPESDWFVLCVQTLSGHFRQSQQEVGRLATLNSPTERSRLHCSQLIPLGFDALFPLSGRDKMNKKEFENAEKFFEFGSWHWSGRERVKRTGDRRRNMSRRTGPFTRACLFFITLGRFFPPPSCVFRLHSTCKASWREHVFCPRRPQVAGLIPKMTSMFQVCDIREQAKFPAKTARNVTERGELKLTRYSPKFKAFVQI